MNCRPILFSGPMVRALLEGRKTQTRRICKGQRELSRADDFQIDRCPYGQPGDLLTVRETWQYADWTEDGYPFIGYRADDARTLIERDIPGDWSERLSDIWADLSDPKNYDIDGRAADRRWRPAIHMPRWASRLTLRITDVRVQRLQDISYEDALAEGVGDLAAMCQSLGDGGRNPAGESAEETARRLRWPQRAYAQLWESINGPGSWDANPWVWAISFDVIRANVDSVLTRSAA